MAIVGNAGLPSGLPGQSSEQAYAGLMKDPGYLQTSAETARQIAMLEADILEAKRRALIDYGDPDLAAKALGENRQAGPDQIGWYVGGIGDKGINGPVADLPPRFAGVPEKLQEQKWFATQREAREYADSLTPGAFGLVRAVGAKRPMGQGATVKAAEANPYSTLANLRRSRELSFRDLRENLNKANLFYSSERGRREGLLGVDYGGRTQQATVSMERFLADLDKQLGRAKEEQNLQKQRALMTAASKGPVRPGGR